MKILIIDDEQDLCLLLKKYLDRHAYETAVAHTLSEGLAVAKSFQPDLVFLDNNLPDGFGVNHIDKLKAAVKNLRIIMVSAMQPLLAEEYTGLDAFIEKPISFAKIKQVLSTIGA